MFDPACDVVERRPDYRHHDVPFSPSRPAHARTPGSDDVLALRAAILSKLAYAVGKEPTEADDGDWFRATALAVRDRMVDRWTASRRHGARRVHYFSLEFLIGRLLSDALGNLELTETAREALSGLGVDLERVRAVESDAALGNGGLGRLAACFMDSLASLAIPAYGYGIRYDHGLFRQVIRDGQQEEVPESWLSHGNPWEFERSNVAYPVRFGGTVTLGTAMDGSIQRLWHASETVLAVAYDTPVVGWRGRHVNTLRLWSARAPDPLQLETFNSGDHVGAVADRSRA